MDDVREATVDLLADKPEAEDALREILEVNEEGTWAYDDLSIDSGTFGEIVSRGIVEDRADGYRIADRHAVQAVLNGEEDLADKTGGTDIGFSSVSLPDIDRQTALIVGGAFALVAVVRIAFMWSSVFRGSDIILAGNDPYYYRYWVDTLLVSDLQAFDFGSLTELPEGVANSDVLLIITLWWSASLISSGQTASGLVVAWYPVIAGVVSALLVYLLTVQLTADKRIGLAATLMLSVIPAHSYRSSLGFGDHHAFDFVWLMLLALSLSILFDGSKSHSWSSGATCSTVLLLAISIVGQTTAWRGSPILLLPVAVSVFLFVFITIRADLSPLIKSQWLLAGLSLGAGVTLFIFSVLDWMQLYRGIAPLLLMIGSTVTVGLGEVLHRYNRSATEFGVFGILFIVAGIAMVLQLVPEMRQAIDLLFNFLTSSRNIAETQPLFTTELGILGPIFIFGLALFLALPYVADVVWKLSRDYRPKWIPVVAFTGSLLVMTIVQLRFGGELSVFMTIFSGIGLVDISRRVEIVDSAAFFTGSNRGLSIPNVKTLKLLFLLFILIAGMGLVQTVIKQQQISHERSTVATATWIDDYAAEENLDYPENYVLTQWGSVRFYNYQVSGMSKGYGYALNNYLDFLAGENPYEWYDRLEDDVGFVMIDTTITNSPNGVMQQRLGSGPSVASTASLHNYRAVYQSPDGQYLVYELVDGATITGIGPSNSSVIINSSANLSSTQYSYEREFDTTRNGWYTVTVSQPGTYTIGQEQITVDSAAVRNGSALTTVSTNASFYWSFDEGTDETAYELFGTNHGRIHNAQRVQGVEGDALQFDPTRNSTLNARLHDGGPEQFTVSVWVRPTALDTGPENEPRQLVRTDDSNVLLIEETGAVSFRVPGVTTENFRTGTVPTNEWTHVAATYNGTHRSVYLDGERVGTNRVGSGNVSWDEQIIIGGASRDTGSFEGMLDEVRIYDDVLSEERIRSVCNCLQD